MIDIFLRFLIFWYRCSRDRTVNYCAQKANFIFSIFLTVKVREKPRNLNNNLIFLDPKILPK